MNKNALSKNEVALLAYIVTELIKIKKVERSKEEVVADMNKTQNMSLEAYAVSERFLQLELNFMRYSGNVVAALETLESIWAESKIKALRPLAVHLIEAYQAEQENEQEIEADLADLVNQGLVTQEEEEEKNNA